MYGSLTAIVLLMLWIYACVCILFYGAEINYYYSLNWRERTRS
jgi:membrane protein